MMTGILSVGELWTILLARTSHAMATKRKMTNRSTEEWFTSSTILAIVRGVTVGRKHEVTTGTEEAVR